MELLERRTFLTVTPDPGSTPATAYNVGDLYGAQTYGDNVGPGDNIDVYKFKMTQAGHFYGRLRAYNASAEIDLLRQTYDAQGNSIITLVDFRTATPDSFESGDFDRVLQAGTYYINIQSLGGQTEYLTRMTADYAGETLGTARDIGSVVHETYADFVGDFPSPSLEDTADVYKLKIDYYAHIQFLLEHDNDYATPGVNASHMELITDLNNNGQIDAQETWLHTQPNVAGIIDYTVPPGTYYLRVLPDTNFANYHLSLNADYAGDSTQTARWVNGNGALNGYTKMVDWVSQNADFRDAYFFTLDSTRNFTMILGKDSVPIDAMLFQDKNKNGVLDDGEFVTSTVNEGSGRITRTLGAGNYYIQVDAYNGGVGKYSLELDAARVGAISGVVFNDLNGNGVRDAGEPGIMDRLVYVDLNNNGNPDGNEPEAETDAAGLYTLNNISVGTRTVRQHLLPGWSQTSPATNQPRMVTVVANQTTANQNFGTRNGAALNLSSISGTVWNDVNGNGIKDAIDSGIAGRTVYIDANNNSVLDAGEKSAMTSGSGMYMLSGLLGGTYKVRQVRPAGWSQTAPANNYGLNVTLSAGQNATGRNFFTRPTPTGTGSISGSVFADLNRNGARNTGEGGLAAWVVYIDTDNDKFMDTNERRVLTDASGNYSFTGLGAATYKVRAMLKSGFVQTTPANGFGHTVTLASGQSTSGKNFGVDN
jgi:hypothetical protein